jgi:hypothetical protein
MSQIYRIIIFINSGRRDFEIRVTREKGSLILSNISLGHDIFWMRIYRNLIRIRVASGVSSHRVQVFLPWSLLVKY